MPLPTVQQAAERHGVNLQATPGDPTVETFERIYGAALAGQAADCTTVDPDDDRMGEALLRRVGNLWASKAHTLGVLDTGFGELGVQFVPSSDPVVDQLEHHVRTIAVA
jgi:hypothetical protein